MRLAPVCALCPTSAVGRWGKKQRGKNRVCLLLSDLARGRPVGSAWRTGKDDGSDGLGARSFSRGEKR